MTYFDQLYSKLFPGSKKSPEPMVIDDVLKRSESFNKRFEEWKTSDECSELTTDMLNSYRSALIGVGRIPGIVLHQTANSNGFAVSFHEEYEPHSFPFMLDLLAEKVKALGYRSVLSRQTLKERQDEVEKKEMRYLKPKPGFVEPINQLFGNIQIEYTALDEAPYRLKFVANTYSDRKYTTPLSFDELVNKILT